MPAWWWNPKAISKTTNLYYPENTEKLQYRGACCIDGAENCFTEK
ncbi:unnamed protein product [Amoebophrya sp. A120]|nr:unnamed protein product [Amoebophrya sp. A120]|eukprot:GSA120T00021311001.1